MYIANFVGMVEDKKLYIEILDNFTYGSYGFYNVDDLRKNTELMNKRVIKINCQYIGNKRVLLLYI